MPDTTMNPPQSDEEVSLFPKGELYEKRPMEKRDMTTPRSCKACQHMLVCKAFEMVNQVQQQFNREVDFVKFPFPPEALGSNCKEYLPIQSDIGEV